MDTLQIIHDNVKDLKEDVRKMADTMGKLFQKLETVNESLQSHDNRIDNLEKNSTSCKASCKADIDALKKKVEELENRTSLLDLIQRYPKITLVILIALFAYFWGKDLVEIFKIIPLK